MQVRNLFALFGISLIAFVSFLEYTVVNTALPTLQHAFHAPILKLQWVMNIYFLVVGVSMMLVGRLGDMYGRRLVFYCGALLLALASIGAGLSHTIGELIFCRAFQALGVASCITLAPTLIHNVFGDNNQHAMGFYGMTTGIGLALGPVVGGFIVVHFGWPWIFYINVPLLLLAFICSVKFIPETKVETTLPMDIPGAVLLVIGLGGLIYGIIHGAQVTWGSVLTWVPIIAALIALPALVMYENRQSSPIMDFRLFKKPLFMLSALTNAFAGMLSAVALFFDPLFLQHVKAYTPKQAGLILLMIPIAIVFFAPMLGKILKHVSHSTVMILSFIVAFIAALLHLYFMEMSPIILFIVTFILIGLSWTVCNVVPAIAVQLIVKPEQAGVAIGTVFSCFTVFSSIMLTLAVVVFHFISRVDHGLGPKASFTSGMHSAFTLLSVTLFFGVIYGLFLWRKVARLGQLGQS